MNGPCFPEEALLKWPRPDRACLSEKIQRQYDKRAAALADVIGGADIATAARHRHVNRRTLTKVCNLSVETHPQGDQWGFRACLPYSRRSEIAFKDSAPPVAAAPHSFAKLLAAMPALLELIVKFKGPLPTRRSASAAFERLVRSFKKLLGEANLGHTYPLNTPDNGRRALRDYVKKFRQGVLEAASNAAAFVEDDLVRLAQLFTLHPMDRCEFDAHRIDVTWHVRIPTPDGGYVVRVVPMIWLFALIDVASRAIVAYSLVIGRGFDKFDVLRFLAKALIPWQPRDLIVPELKYLPDAWMPTMVPEGKEVPRALSIGYDNARPHLAILTLENLVYSHLGIMNAGRAHVPESRAHIEAFFKIVEENVLRFIAGGFRPGTERGEKPTRTTQLKSTDYPLEFEALEDVMDVFVTGYNVSDRGGLYGRTPREVCESYEQSGGWLWTSSRSSEDARAMRILRVLVTIRGSKRNRKQPHVYWFGARYRAPFLYNRWDLVGKKYWASIPFEDLHLMPLHDKDNGNLFAVLNAQPPWNQVHSHDVRKKILSWKKQGRMMVRGTEDAVEAYHAYVRANAPNFPELVADYVANAGRYKSSKPNVSPAPARIVAPRDGWITLGRRRPS